MGKETSIRLLVGCRGEATFFKVWVEMHWAALRAGAECRARRKCDQGFQNFDHRLRWLESPGVHLHNLGGGLAQFRCFAEREKTPAQLPPGMRRADA